MQKSGKGSKAKPGTLGFALQGEHGGFEPHVIALIHERVTKLVVSREVVMIDPSDRGMTIPTFLGRLDSIIPKHGLSEQHVLDAPVLVQEQTVISVEGLLEDIALIVVGLHCENLDSQQTRVSVGQYISNVAGMRAAMLSQKYQPDYLWQIYDKALRALERLMGESG